MARVAHVVVPGYPSSGILLDCKEIKIGMLPTDFGISS